MGDERQERPAASSGGGTTNATTTTTSTLALTPAECELMELALGELLSSTRREEHMIADIHSLLAKVRAATPPT